MDESATAGSDAGPPRRVRVRVPATSANLGPGFDSFGLALGMYDEVEVELTRSGLRVDVVGADAVAQDETHLVVRAMRATFDTLGHRQPGLALRCVNRIPHGRGLGSSAAAIVAGIVAAAALARPDGQPSPTATAGSRAAAGPQFGPARMLRLASEIEGHPDNVAAALAGGFTVAWQDVSGARSLRVDPFPELRPVVFVPAVRQSTEQSRGALPAQVPLADAARTLGRAALLALALAGAGDGDAGTDPPTSGPVGAGRAAQRSVRRAEALWSATEDVLHQPYRLPAAPATAALVARLRQRGIAAALSGSGPSVIALAVGGDQAAAAVSLANAEFTVAPLAVDRHGAQVTAVEATA